MAERAPKVSDPARLSRLRSDAEAASAALPALLVAAERLAATVILGAHGRRRPGLGETFWQYRRARPGDPLPSVDWRRSARSDAMYIRETEWEAAQTVWIWRDASAAMDYASGRDRPTKANRAALLAAALAVLLSRGGERVAAIGDSLAGRPAAGEAQLRRLMAAFLSPRPDEDFGAPPLFDGARGGKVVFLSDFFGDETALTQAAATAAAKGLDGLMLQIVDPAEEAFPFDGRIRFESMTGALAYETDRAGALRDDYRAALARRRERLSDIARQAGWRFSIHRTDQSAASALLWLAQGLSAQFQAGGSRS